MTDDERRETHARITAGIMELEAERARKYEAALGFLGFCTGYLNLRDPDWKPQDAAAAFQAIRTLRRELAAVFEEHFPHLLDREDHEANAVRREETAP